MPRRTTAQDDLRGGGAGEDLPTLSLGDGMNIAHALTALGFSASNGEAKRKIAEGAVRLDDRGRERSSADRQTPETAR